MSSPMEEMLRQREEKMTREREATEGLVTHYQTALPETVPHVRTVRSTWAPRPRREYSGLPSREVVRRVRQAWHAQTTRPTPVFQRPIFGSLLGGPSGFWAWVQWLGPTHTVRHYLGQWSQHIDMLPHEVTMLTFEACQFYLTHVVGTDSWSVQTIAPYSCFSSMVTDGPTGLDRMDALSNSAWGAPKHGFLYFDDSGATSNDSAHLILDSTGIYLQQ